MKHEDYSKQLDYGIMGFGRRQIVGVTGIGDNTGVTTVCNVLNYELARIGKDKKVFVMDEPENIEDMDHIICVIDPSPSKIKANIEKYREMRSMYENDDSRVTFLLNKMNEGVDLDILQKFLQFSFVYIQEAVDQSELYRAEYLNRNIMRSIDFAGIKKLAHDAITKTDM